MFVLESLQWLSGETICCRAWEGIVHLPNGMRRPIVSARSHGWCAPPKRLWRSERMPGSATSWDGYARQASDIPMERGDSRVLCRAISLRSSPCKDRVIGMLLEARFPLRGAIICGPASKDAPIRLRIQHITGVRLDEVPFRALGCLAAMARAKHTAQRRTLPQRFPVARISFAPRGIFHKQIAGALVAPLAPALPS